MKFNIGGNISASPKAVNSNFKKSFSSYEGQFSFSPSKIIKSINSNSEKRNTVFTRKPTYIAKKLSTLPSYQYNKIVNRSKLFLSGTSSARSIFHHSMNHLRKLPFFKINTPKLSLLDGRYYLLILF